MQPARQPRLRQKHGAELAGADQADGDRLTGSVAFEEQRGEIHGGSLSAISQAHKAPAGTDNVAIPKRHAATTLAPDTAIENRLAVRDQGNGGVTNGTSSTTRRLPDGAGLRDRP